MRAAAAAEPSAANKKIIWVPGGGSIVDTIFVQHYNAEGNPDGLSSITCKTFEQRREKLQSESADLIWIDEKRSFHRCDDDAQGKRGPPRALLLTASGDHHQRRCHPYLCQYR
jgi:hypothetical protein